MVNDLDTKSIVGEMDVVMMILHAMKSMQHKYLLKEESSVTKLQEKW